MEKPKMFRESWVVSHKPSGIYPGMVGDIEIKISLAAKHSTAVGKTRYEPHRSLITCVSHRDWRMMNFGVFGGILKCCDGLEWVLIGWLLRCAKFEGKDPQSLEEFYDLISSFDRTGEWSGVVGVRWWYLIAFAFTWKLIISLACVHFSLTSCLGESL